MAPLPGRAMASFVASGMVAVMRDETEGDETDMTGRRDRHGTGCQHRTRKASRCAANIPMRVAMAATMVVCPLAMSGCGDTGGNQPSHVGARAPKGNATTIHDLMTEYNTSYTKLRDGIKSGDSLPYMMGYDVSYNWGMMAVADEETITQAWKALADISLIGPDPDAPSVEDGGIQFTFVWSDGTKLPFTFVTSEWFRGPDKQMYYVMESDVIANLAREAEASAVPIESIERPKPMPAADPSTAAEGATQTGDGKDATEASG